MAEKVEVKNEEENVVDKILNGENTDNIILYDEKDNPIEFEQIAVIPINNLIYAILMPVEKVDGVDNDEALVFLIEEDEENQSDLLTVVDDEKTIDEVFNIYYQLCDDANANPKKK